MPQAWNSKLNEVPIHKGFVRSKNDYAMYYETKMQEGLMIGVYVDDMTITRSNSHKIISFKENMKKVFEMIDVGILSSYLGVEIKRATSSIWLNQRSYIEYMLQIFKMSDCNSVKTPMEVLLKLEKDRREEEKNTSQFRSLIGSLWYLVHT